MSGGAAVEVQQGPGYQRTVARPVRWSGVGLHTGEPSMVEVRPLESGGVWFRVGSTRFPALPSRVVDTRRCTTLGADGCRVSTVEHLLAALHAEEIESVEVEVRGPEVPALDGSAQPFAEALRAAGTRETPVPRRFFVLRQPVLVANGNGSSVVGRPLGGAEGQPGTGEEGARRLGLRVSARITLRHPLLENQSAWSLVEPDRFRERIAPSRTFGLYEEVEALLKEGKARGASLDNALVVFPTHYSSRLRVLHEPARHKVLDLLGDLALAGGRLVGSVHGRGSSHQLHVQFAARVRELSGSPAD